MSTVIENAYGRKFLMDQSSRLREVVDLRELMTPEFWPFVFIRDSIERYALHVNGRYYDFHKSYMFGKGFYLQFKNFSSRTKQPAAYLLISNPSGKFYIGSSGNIAARLGGHRKLFKSRTHFKKQLSDDIEKYGGNCIQAVVIYQDSKDAALELEQFLLDFFKGHPLLTNVGTNAEKPQLGVKRSELTKTRQSTRLKKVWQNPLLRERARAIKKEFFSDPSNREHMSKKTREYFENNPDAKQKHTERMLARFSTEESRAAQSEKIASAWQDPEKRQRFEVGFKKRATPINVQGHVYAGYTQASKALGLDPSLIRHRVLSKLDTWKEWVFADADGNPIQKETISHEEMLTRANEKRVATFNQPEYRKQLSRQRLETFSNPAVIEKMRAAREGQAKPVRIDGVVYASIAQAARQLNVSEAKVNFRVSSPSERFKTWQFV